MLEINKIYCMNCLDGMKLLDDNSIDLVVTSPPYYVLRSYAHWNTYEEYIGDNKKWFEQMTRILKPGGYICWNVQDVIPDPTKFKDKRCHYPLMPDIIKIGMDLGLFWEKNVIWDKNHSTAVYFGSFPKPGTPVFMPVMESIIILRKDGKCELPKNEREEQKLDKNRWFEIVRNIWRIQPESAKRVNHPAPFPLEIPKRFIEIMTTKSSIVLDPFMGSGTTAIAAKILGRNYIGFDYTQEYIDIAMKRLEKV